MRAAWYTRTGPPGEVLTLGNLPTPEPGPGDVLVRVRASGLNPADVKRRAGWGGARMEHELVVPHTDGAGDVVSVGEGVDPAVVGRRVWVWKAQGGYGEAGRAMGTAANYVSVPFSQTEPLPEMLSYAEGACLGVPAQTASIALFSDGSIEGQTILVPGAAGAVGHFVVQFARARGARVIATVSGPKKAALAEEAGADLVFNYRTDDVGAKISEATDGEGVDRIIEVDFAANLETNTKIIKRHGVIASYSSTSNPTPELPYYPFAFKAVTVRFVQGFLMTDAEHETAKTLIDELCRQNKLIVAIGARHELDGIAAAHEQVENGSVTGNVVLEL